MVIFAFEGEGSVPKSPVKIWHRERLKKRRKKLTTTGKHGTTMYQVFFWRFYAFFKIFQARLGKNSKNVTRVYVCVKAKLTFVSFF